METHQHLKSTADGSRNISVPDRSSRPNSQNNIMDDHRNPQEHHNNLSGEDLIVIKMEEEENYVDGIQRCKEEQGETLIIPQAGEDLTNIKIEEDYVGSIQRCKEEEIPTVISPDTMASSSLDSSRQTRHFAPLINYGQLKGGAEEELCMRMANGKRQDITKSSNDRKMSEKREFLREFIEVYQANPCLWQTKSADYCNKQKRAVAMQALVDVAKMYYTRANVEFVKQKIQNIRTVYKKELNKVQESKRAGGDEVYTPRLWYYHLLSFTANNETPSPSFSSLDESPDVTQDSIEESEMPSVLMEEPSCTQTQERLCAIPTIATGKRRQELGPDRGEKRPRQDADTCHEELTKAVLETAQKCFEKQMDRFDAFGMTVACKLREMDERYRDDTERIINEALYRGRRGEINERTTLPRSAPVTPQQQSFQHTYPPQYHNAR